MTDKLANGEEGEGAVSNGGTLLWHFNEAVSLLREARLYVPGEVALAAEIDKGLPAIQSALETSAALQRDPSGVFVDLYEELTTAKALLRKWIAQDDCGCADCREMIQETEAWL